MVTPISSADFALRVRVYWEDTDAGGIVFYANYVKFFERARTEWLRSLGFGQEALRRQTGGMFVVGSTTVRYLQPARLDDELNVTARVVEAGRASLTFAQQALRQGQVLAEGEIRVGWVETLPHHAGLRARRIPQDVLNALAHVLPSHPSNDVSTSS